MATKKKTTAAKPAKKVTNKNEEKKFIEMEEIMNKTSKKESKLEKYKPSIIVGIVVVFIMLLIVSNMDNDKTNMENNQPGTESSNVSTDAGEKALVENTTLTTAAEYAKTMKEDKLNVFYLASPTCSYCVTFAPVLIEVIKEYGLKVNYININNEDQAGFNAIMKSSPELEEFGTPTMVVTKNNEVLNISVGASTKDGLIKFLKDNNIITE